MTQQLNSNNNAVSTGKWGKLSLLSVSGSDLFLEFEGNWNLTKIVTSGPISLWQIDGETIETKRDFILGGSKIIADGDCSHEIKRCLFLGRKAVTNLDSILKSRDITLLDKGPSGQSYGFSSSHVRMLELDHKEGWVTKNWWFWTVVLEKTLESPLDWRRSNQSILKEISPEYSSEGRLLKLKLQYLSRLVCTADSLDKSLMLERLRAREEGETERWLDGITDSMDLFVTYK